MLCHQAQPQPKRPPLPSRKPQIIDCILIVHHRIRIPMPSDVDSGHPHSPFVSSKLEFFFQANIQTQILRKPVTIWRAVNLLPLVYYAERKSSSIFKKSAEQ